MGEVSAPARARAGRYELARALGAISDDWRDRPPCAESLGLGSLSREDHTEVFVLAAPPYASIYLGTEGMLGGEAADRIAGFWRVLGCTPAPGCDHLSSLLSFYAYLGESADALTGDAGLAADNARRALLCEHLWSWVPPYALAVRSLGVAGIARWAESLVALLAAELADLGGAYALPAALGEAPGFGAAGDGLDGLLDDLLSPVRCGFVITWRSLRSAASRAGLAPRAGERRFALRSLLEQDPAAMLGWLATEARRSERLLLEVVAGPDPVAAWWSARCGQSAEALLALAGAQRRSAPDWAVGH